MLVILDNIASLFRDMELYDEALDVTAQADVITTRLLARVESKKGTDVDRVVCVLFCSVSVFFLILFVFLFYLSPHRFTKNFLVCCNVLYCFILYCIVLYCIVLYCIVLYCTR